MKKSKIFLSIILVVVAAFALTACGTLDFTYVQNSDGTYTYERRTNTLRNASTQPRDVLLPIPETEANNLFSLTNKRWQNSGW